MERAVVWAPPPPCALSVTQVNSHSHRDIAAKIETAARRALLASNASQVLLWGLLEGRVAPETQQDLEDR